MRGQREDTVMELCRDLSKVSSSKCHTHGQAQSLSLEVLASGRDPADERPDRIPE